MIVSFAEVGKRRSIHTRDMSKVDTFLLRITKTVLQSQRSGWVIDRMKKPPGNTPRSFPHFVTAVQSLCLVAALLFAAGAARGQDIYIAYDVPGGTPSNQNGLSSAAVGMDFDV